MGRWHTEQQKNDTKNGFRRGYGGEKTWLNYNDWRQKKTASLLFHNPVNEEELKDRKEQYQLLSDKQFAFRYNHMLFLPVEFTWDGITHKIQYNFCTNPYCKWYGQEQFRFEAVKGKPSRYKLSGRGSKKSLVCNPDPMHPDRGMTLNCNSITVSNWSVAEEISRLIRINQTQDVDPDYNFHKDGCTAGHLTPFETPDGFYKQGKTLNNSQRWQCKVCKKRQAFYRINDNPQLIVRREMIFFQCSQNYS